MMGRLAKQTELWVEPVELGKRIPEDHLLRKIGKILDLRFVHREVSGFYGRNGHVSADPVVIMKLMLLLFLDDVRSERELMRVVPLRIDYLWFLGFGLEDAVPDHSVLSKARARWGSEVFARVFERTIGQCVKAGLVDGEKLHVDASLIRANASRNSVIKVVVEAQMEKLDEKREAANTRHRSTSDPDSTVVRHRDGPAVPSYKNHRVVDDKAGVITATKTTTGAVDEGQELCGMVGAHEQNTAQRARVVVADCRYGNTANFIALAKRGVRTHMGDLRSRLRNARAEGIYPASDFPYDKTADTFLCPAKKLLHRHHFNSRRGYFEYRPKAGVCASCLLRSACTHDKAGRTIKRYENQELLDRARRQSHSLRGRLDRKRRQWLQERNFGEAAVDHGFKRARWRGLGRQRIQDNLIAAIQNLRILARRMRLPNKSPLFHAAAGLKSLILTPFQVVSDITANCAREIRFFTPLFGQQPVNG